MPREWLHSGLLLHPSLAIPKREGEYTLTVYSDAELDLEPIADTSSHTTASQWVSGVSDGGCALHAATWRTNPSFLIKPFAAVMDEVTTLHITLQRPSAAWTRAVKADSIGSMIGFYVVTTPSDTPAKHNGTAGILHESAFVPMHSVDGEVSVSFPDLAARGMSVVVVPTTFEPRLAGPFTLTVTGSVEFELVPTA
jgi:hypothetical protein